MGFLKQSSFQRTGWALLGEFIFECLLNLDERKRLAPIKALKTLKQTLMKLQSKLALSQTLEPSSSNVIGCETPTSDLLGSVLRPTSGQMEQSQTSVPKASDDVKWLERPMQVNPAKSPNANATAT